MNLEIDVPNKVQPCFHPRRLGHVNLWVNALEVSERFYSGVGGLRREFIEPALQASFLGTGHTPHDVGVIQTTRGVARYGRNGLLQVPATIGLEPGLNHLAWELENEKALVDGYTRLRELGVKVYMTVDHQIAHSIYIADPDGNSTEFYVDTIKDWRSKVFGEMDLLTSHWDPLEAEGFTDARYDLEPELNRDVNGLVAPWRLSHAVLQSNRVAENEEFYVTIAGLNVVQRQVAQGREVVYLRAGLRDYQTYSLVIIEGQAASFDRLSFRLKNGADFDRSLAAVRHAGVAIEYEVNLPWKRAFFLRDPDGFLNEYYVGADRPINLAEAGNVPFEYAI